MQSIQKDLKKVQKGLDKSKKICYSIDSQREEPKTVNLEKYHTDK